MIAVLHGGLSARAWDLEELAIMPLVKCCCGDYRVQWLIYSNYFE
jgi:hypothetical protein